MGVRYFGDSAWCCEVCRDPLATSGQVGTVDNLGSGCVRVREARIVRSRPPSVQPATRPDPASPSAGGLVSRECDAGEWVTSGGAGRIGSKRIDPGAPATPRPAIAGRPGACRRGHAPPSPSIRHGKSISGR
jgi:hypothetical protein